MPLAVAIVGPGRVGRALGRLWHDGGVELLGFAGGRAGRADAAVAFCGAGRALASTDLSAADAVALTVPDAAIAEAASQHAPRPGSTWFHCAGFHSLEPLRGLRDAGAHTGSLHPTAAVSDPEIGYHALPGVPAVLCGDPGAQAVLTELAERAGLVPMWSRLGDRAAYHAACALAANGATALYDLTRELFERQCGFAAADAVLLTRSLIGSALAACARSDAHTALTGPVARGDHEVVAAHLRAIGTGPAGATYRALMQRATSIARDRGALDERTAAAFDALLGADG